MKGALRTALQFYTRTRLQRWLLIGASLLFTADLMATRLGFAIPHSGLWRFVSGMLAIGAAAMLTISGGADFRRISSLRTVSLIPYSKLKLVSGLCIAQLTAAAAGTILMMIVGQPEPLPPLTWGTPRGTFEMLFGVALSIVVLVQIIAGPSRVLSLGSVALVATLIFRVDLLMKPELLGMPKADAWALAGILAWILFALWYVCAWRPAAAFSAWGRGAGSVGGIAAAAPAGVSRQSAIQACLLGRPSLLRVCAQQLVPWICFHLVIVATMTGMTLKMARHGVPANYSGAIIVLLYAPVVGVHTIAGSVARGSRRLWLGSGEPRHGLYAIATRLAWKSLALLGLPMFGLAFLEMRFLPHAGDDMLLTLAVFIALAPCALYFGLLNFQRRLNLSFIFLYLVAVGAISAAFFVESRQAQLLLWMTPVTLIAIGCALRTLARRRWYGIDWLRFRAERATSPFAARRGH